VTALQSWLLIGVVVAAAFAATEGFRLFGDLRELRADYRDREARLDRIWDDGDEPSANLLVHRTTDGTVIEFPLSPEWPLIEVAELVGRIEALPEVGA
jgi:hypothetical protein